MALEQAGGLLADVVVPAGYAVRGGLLAADLRRYKSASADEAGAAAAAGRLRQRLDAFLRERGDCVWRQAGMAAGPDAAAVVPSGQGRTGPHPLTGIVGSCTGLPLVSLAVQPGALHGRGVNRGWVRVGGGVAGGGVAGAGVLVVDDTWVSGGSAQSVAAALKLAGAGPVAVVVLGRDVNPADPRSAAFIRALFRAGAADGRRPDGPRR